MIVNFAYAGSLRIDGEELIGPARDIRITHGSVDGQPLPEDVKAALLKGVNTGGARYRLERFTRSELRNSDEKSATICERSPVKLNL